MILNFNKVSFKNFFSYGKVPQELEFKSGINVIFGYDEDRKRSNAAGKSALLETIPFALFGKTNKPVKKEQIINWKNKKNCEVILEFQKGKNNYKILRAIKPDKLEIYENNILIPISSDIREYQKILENDILSLDFLSFVNLIHTNLNNLTPVLKLNAEKKRKFLEKIFSLETYSKINEKNNEYLRSLNEKQKLLENKIIQIVDFNSNLELKNKELVKKLNSIGLSEDELANITLQLKNLKFSNDYFINLQTLKNDLDKIIESYNSELLSNKKIINTLNDDIIRKNKENNEIEQKIKKNIEYNKIKEKYIDIKNKFDIIKGNEDELLLNISKLKGQIKEYNDSLMMKKGSLSTFKNNLSTIKDKDICPLCRSILSPECKEEINEEIISNENEIKNIENILDELNKKIFTLEKEHDNVKNIETEKLNLERKLTDFSDGILIQNIEKNKNDINIINEKISDFENDNLFLSDIKKRYENDRIYLINEINELIKISNKINELEINKKILLEKIKQEKIRKQEIQELLTANELEINKNEKDKGNCKKEIAKSDRLITHINYLKFLCKDENIKQYALSSYLPYLNKQVNFYLSESGANFYLILNSWLDAVIEGPGINNCVYDNLSGGEQRSIDLSMQLAFLDISRLQANIWPDILSLDEILDSSIDSSGLKQMIRIIKNKQRKENNKVFIITHRNEIDDLEFTNGYMVTKKNGYSQINKI